MSLSRIDRNAMQRAIALTRAEDNGRREQIDHMRRTDNLEEVGAFCASHCQSQPRSAALANSANLGRRSCRCASQAIRRSERWPRGRRAFAKDAEAGTYAGTSRARSMPLPKLNERQRYENEDRARMGGAASRGQVRKRATKKRLT